MLILRGCRVLYNEAHKLLDELAEPVANGKRNRRIRSGVGGRTRTGSKGAARQTSPEQISTYH